MDEQFLFSTLELLCRIPSPAGKEGPLAVALRDHAIARGFHVKLVEVAPRRPNVLIDSGEGGTRSVLFSAHLDTQRAGENPTSVGLRPPWFYGDGANNMKASLAAMLAAADVLRTQRSGRVTILAAIGEIDSLGRGTVSALRSGVTADGAINGEPTDLGIVLRHAGVARFRIKARGRSVHISRGTDSGNAVLAIARVVAALDESLFSQQASSEFPGLPLLNVGVIRGGSHASLLAGAAHAELDVRWAPPMTPASIKADIDRRIASVHLPGGTEIDIAALGPPRFYGPRPFVCDPRSRIVKAVEKAHREVVGTSPRVGSWMPQSGFGSDAPHLVDAGISTCMYGPGGDEDTGPAGERIAWSAVTAAARVYERAAGMFLKSSP